MAVDTISELQEKLNMLYRLGYDIDMIDDDACIFSASKSSDHEFATVEISNDGAAKPYIQLYMEPICEYMDKKHALAYLSECKQLLTQAEKDVKEIF